MQKTVTTRGSRKKTSWGGGGKTKNAPTPYGERYPPHGENGPHMETKDCPHRKNAPVGEKSPPCNFLFMLLPPGRTHTFALLFCECRSWPQLTLSRLFERVRKKIAKIKQRPIFLALSLKFAPNTHNFICQ